jgi:hypothetical protein
MLHRSNTTKMNLGLSVGAYALPIVVHAGALNTIKYKLMGDNPSS